MEKALSSLFLSILRTVNERKDHIPPITTSDGNPFPYQVITQNEKEKKKNMLSLQNRAYSLAQSTSVQDCDTIRSRYVGFNVQAHAGYDCIVLAKHVIKEDDSEIRHS